MGERERERVGNREVGTEAGCLAYEGVFNPGSTVYTYTSFHYLSLDACMHGTYVAITAVFTGM